MKYSDEQAELARQEQAQRDQQREAERSRQLESDMARASLRPGGESSRSKKSSSRPSNQVVNNLASRSSRDILPNDLARGRPSNTATTSLNASQGSGSSKRATSSNDGHFRHASHGGFRRRDNEDIEMYSLNTGISDDHRSRSADPRARGPSFPPSKKDKKQREEGQQR